MDKDGQDKFKKAIAALQGDISVAATVMYVDPKLRLEYSRRIKMMSDDLYGKASRGVITWEQAAAEANLTRNTIMELIRGRSTPIGQSLAQRLKVQGKTFNELIAYKTRALYGRQANFRNLSETQKNRVYAAVVESAGKSNHQVNSRMQRLSAAGKGLAFLTLAIAVYEIYDADDKVKETKRQVAIGGAGIAGGWAGGAIAGLICGPGAPVCAVVGAFAGGALAAWEMSGIWR
ncbi:hypothetical protein D781_0105 [Serratia sp. FGI94]|uniref:hypothetical protein n=1 Tax=Serratia sp. FGI94 TaxID=671990 RepID=UPI0002A7341C|nr:hypothetical protein [Serratia sp. FGI94]AGB80500.1 hypothetical protein D781_0105 [Serratia sp. FGI94]